MREGLLFLCHRIPYPPNKGDKIRAWHFLAHLADRYDVHLGCLVDDPVDWAHVPALERVCASVRCVALEKGRQRMRSLLRFRPGRPLTLDYFGNAALRGWVADMLSGRAITRIFVFSSGMAEYALDAAGPFRVLDMVDIDSEKFAGYARRTSWPARLVWSREARTLLAFERRAAMAFDRTLLVTAAEVERFVELAPETQDRIGYIENGVDLAYFAPGPGFTCPYQGAGPWIVFTGAMDYWPNIDAVTWFAAEVLPRIRAAVPAAKFAIVGASPAPDVLNLRGDGVIVTGTVPDVRPYLAHATVSVAPLRIARGVQNKVLEAMAMGCAVVASPEAFEGVRAEPGRDLLVADGASEMSDQIVGVIGGSRGALGEAARRAMESGYDWNSRLAALDAVMEPRGAPADRIGVAA